MSLREDILRGVRLFAVVFAAILVCVAGYRALRPPSEVQGAAPEIPEAAAPPVPVPENAAEAQPLVVPEAPPTAGAPVKRAVRAQDPGVPPPPPLASPVRARRAVPPAAEKEFEASQPVALPPAPVEEPSDQNPLTPKEAVGYKSLLEANPNRPPVEPAPGPPAEPEKPAKGNRFFKAVGKIFHPKKETSQQ